MRWDPSHAAQPQSRPHTMTEVMKRFQRLRALAAIRPAGQRATTNLLASFGMISGLLLAWAMVVTM